MAGRIGIHGTSARWAPATLSDGLVRPSAAWFLAGTRRWDAERLPTLSAAIYVAISDRTRKVLCAEAAPGRYRAFFARCPERLPCLTLFDDDHTGPDEAHRYRWLGGRRPRLTAPYTKVERAGRGLAPSALHAEPALLQISIEQIAAAEKAADELADGDSWWSDRRLLDRTAVDASPDGPAPAAVFSKLASLCSSLAAFVEPAVDHAVASMERDE